MSPFLRFLWIPLGLLALSACSNRLNISDVEAQIKADIERQGRRLTLKAVRCPSDVERQSGAYFRCVGELDPEGTFTINVTQQDNQGTLDWEVPNSRVMLNLGKVEAAIQQGLAEALGKRGLVDCGSELYRPNQSGDQFECAIVGGITDGTAQIDSVLVKVDADGNLDWQEIRRNTQAMAASPAMANPSDRATPQSNPAAASTAPPQEQPAPKVTTTTGPSGREIKRPYVPGDND